MHRRLVFRIVVPTTLIGFFCAVGLTSYSTYRTYPDLHKERETQPARVVAQIQDLLNGQEAYYKNRVATSLALLQAEAFAIGAPRLRRTVQVGDVRVPNLYFGLYRQGNRFAIVDYVHQVQPGFAELYIHNGSQFINVSTTRTRSAGERAVGQAFNWASIPFGSAYYGQATVDGEKHYVAVEPMYDKNQEVIGRWVAGIPFDGWATLQSQLVTLAPPTDGFLHLKNSAEETVFSSTDAAYSNDVDAQTVQASFEPWGIEISAGYTVPSVEAILHANLEEQLLLLGGVSLGVGFLLWLLLYVWVQRPIARFRTTLNQLLSTGSETTTSTSFSFTQLAAAVSNVLTQWQQRTEQAETNAQTAQSTLTEAEATYQAILSEGKDQDKQRSLLHDALNRLAARDLTVQLPTNASHALAPLFEALNQAVRTQRQMQQDLAVALTSTHQTATDIASATDQLASASHEQSMQTEDVVVAVSQMTATISENAESASQAATIARQSGQEAAAGGEIVNQTVTKIREIADVFTESSASIAQLHDSSQQISQIVALITDIAEQTNLLALNAAIEAARAGEHGKSFAVVAGEVRGLASRTREATTEIAQMIERIQHETAQAVQAMDRGTSEVQEGLRLADATGTALQQIVKRANETENTVTQIATANEEQSATSEEITRSVSSIAEVTSGAASEVARIAEAATSLRALTEEIQTLLQRPTATIHTFRQQARVA